jgi:hypothetical protein
MGHYKITIKGLGSHHNTDNKADADKMAFEFVNRLKYAGHNISEATFEKISPMDTDNLLAIGGSIDFRNNPPVFYGGEPTALTMKQVMEIESGVWNKKTTWTSGNFQKALDTIKVLYAELDKIKKQKAGII